MRRIPFAWGTTHFIVGTVVAVLYLLFLGPDAFCKLTEDHARELARTAVQKALERYPHKFLQITRDVVLEKQFRACLSETLRSTPFIFRASTEGQERIDENTVIDHLSTSPLTIIVAVTDVGRVFLIHGNGISASKRQFEEFALEQSVRLSTPELAREYFRFYLDVNPGNFVISPLASSIQLKEQAEQKFRSSMGEEEGLREFNIWWEEYGAKIGRLDFNMQVSRTKKGFSATFYVLSGVDSKKNRIPGILRVTLVVSPQGHVGKWKLTPLRLRNMPGAFLKPTPQRDVNPPPTRFFSQPHAKT